MRHLLSTEDLSLANAVRILDTAEEMAAVGEREVKKLPDAARPDSGQPVLRGLHPHPHLLRAAAKRLSADVINFAAKGSSVSKGESLKDTAQTFPRWAPTPSSSGTGLPAPRTGSPPRTGSTPRHRRRRRHPRTPHPGAAGRVTMRRHWSNWPAPPPRVQTSGHAGRDRRGRAALPGGPFQRLAARTLGAEVTLVAPPTLLPIGVESGLARSATTWTRPSPGAWTP